MTFLPIVERELRMRARLPSTYGFRFGAAVGAIVIVGGLLVLAEQFVLPGGFGPAVLRVSAWLTFAYCLLEGTRHTADCLSEEKRAGTLGLLFLTDLRGYDVVLGKLMATSLNSFYSLIALLPPMAIPLVLGGVTGGEFWRLALALMNTLFFSLTAGLLISAISRQARQAWEGALALTGLFAVAFPLIPAVAAQLSALAWVRPVGTVLSVLEPLAAISPSTGLLSAFEGAYRTDPDRFWNSIRGIHLLSWAALVGASCLLPRCWQDAPRTRKKSRLQLTFERWRKFLPARFQTRRPELLERHPLLKLAGHEPESPVYLWVFVALVGGLGGLAWLAAGCPSTYAGHMLLGMLAVHFVLAVWVATRACYQFAEARDSGVLELLLTTPVNIGEIVDGYVLSLKQLFFWPVMVLLGAEALILIAQAFIWTVQGVAPVMIWLACAGVGLCLLTALLDLYAVAIFGLWQGLYCKKSGQALTRTVLFVLVLPLLGFCCWPLWPVIGVVKNLIFINYGQDQLRRSFREVISGRFSAEPETTTGLRPVLKRKAPPALPSVIDPEPPPLA